MRNLALADKCQRVRFSKRPFLAHHFWMGIPFLPLGRPPPHAAGWGGVHMGAKAKKGCTQKTSPTCQGLQIHCPETTASLQLCKCSAPENPECLLRSKNSIAIEHFFELIFGTGMRRSTFQWRKGFFSEKVGGNSVNGGFGKGFYRKGNSVKTSGRFSEPPDSEKWKVAVLIPFPKITS